MPSITVGSIGLVYRPGSTYTLTATFLASVAVGPIVCSGSLTRTDTGEVIQKIDQPHPGLKIKESATKIFDFKLPATIQAASYAVVLRVNTADAKWTELVKKTAPGFKVTTTEIPTVPTPTPIPPTPEQPPTGSLDQILAEAKTWPLVFNEEWNDLSQWTDREPWQVEPGYEPPGNPNCWAPLPAGDLAIIANGNLILRSSFDAAKRDGHVIAVVELNSRKSFSNFKHGYLEASFRLTEGSEAWPALWMMGNNQWPSTGEIDIFEVVNNGKENGIPYFTVHWAAPPSGLNEGHYKLHRTPPKINSTVMNTWGFLRLPDLLAVFINNVEVARMSRAEVSAESQGVGGYAVVFDEPMHLRINLSSAADRPLNWAENPVKPPDATDIMSGYVRVRAMP